MNAETDAYCIVIQCLGNIPNFKSWCWSLDSDIYQLIRMRNVQLQLATLYLIHAGGDGIFSVY